MSVVRMKTLAGIILGFLLVGVGIFGYFTDADGWGWWLFFGALAFIANS